MGINLIAERFLKGAVKRGVDFSRLGTLGRQQMNSPNGNGYDDAESFLKSLGAKSVTSIDASDYEDATIIHDMNVKVQRDLHGVFSTLLDLGTLEHVFNFPVAIKNCMDMVDVGGHFLGMMPANNVLGHGFYQFSPELLFRVLSPTNGYEVVEVELAEQCDEPPYHPARVAQLKDPAVLGRRLEMRTRLQACLLVTAKKSFAVESLSGVQQSDYLAAWEGAKS